MPKGPIRRTPPTPRTPRSSPIIGRAGYSSDRPEPDYKLARQSHIGHALDFLQDQGRLVWSWKYHPERPRAGYRITWYDPWTYKQRVKMMDTAEAEEFVAVQMAHLGELWIPVKSPGGKSEWFDMLREANGSGAWWSPKDYDKYAR